MIAARLYKTDSADFLALLGHTKLTAGNLSSHLAKLKNAGYVEIRKELTAPRRNTVVRLTARGRKAFQEHCLAMSRALSELAGHSSHREAPPAITHPVSFASNPGAALKTGLAPAPNAGPERGKIIATLKESPVFAGLDGYQLVELSRLAVARPVTQGEFLYHEDEALAYVFVVAEGKIKVLRHSPSGKEFILAVYRRGDLFGNVTLISGKLHGASAQAVFDSQVLMMRTDDLVSLICGHVESCSRVLKSILTVASGRLFDSAVRLLALATERTDQRLAYNLLTLFTELGPTITFTRPEIARMAGTTPETAIRFISLLNRRGIVRSSRGKLVVLQPGKLRDLAEGPVPA
ncbi:MAG: transcriptional regulator [Chloroflexi bacterium]|nr:transcriptional regulator [Chloroflexota bacterium]